MESPCKRQRQRDDDTGMEHAAIGLTVLGLIVGVLVQLRGLPVILSLL